MIQHWLKRSGSGLLVPVLAVALTSAGWGADAPKEFAARAAQQAGEAGEDVAEAAAKNYWLGILATPVEPPLKVHLRLERGVLVEQIVPESPAAKAGIEVHDILLKFGDVELADVDGLQEAVAGNENREVPVTLLRAGQQKTVQVKPEERPADSRLAFPARSGQWDQITEMLKRLDRGEFGEDPLRMFFVRPGFVVPKEFKQRRFELFSSPPEMLRLPKGTRVTLTREHEGPVKIKVEKDDRTWEVTEEELDQLPEEVRPAVKGMLGGGRVYVFGQGPVVVPGEQPAGPGKDAAPQAESASKRPDTERQAEIRDRLEDMKRQLRENEERMQEQLEQLRQQMEKLGQEKI